VDPALNVTMSGMISDYRVVDFVLGIPRQVSGLRGSTYEIVVESPGGRR
jgi:hypothetical protein